MEKNKKNYNVCVEKLQTLFHTHSDAEELFHAIHTADIDKIKYLSIKGISLLVRTTEGYSPLHVAVFSNQLKVLEYLILQGAQLDAKDSLGASALQWAGLLSLPHFAEVLLNYGADPNLTDLLGRTILHCATLEECVPLVEILLQHPRIYVNIKDFKGNTPLYYASEKQNPKIVRLLLNHHANPYAQNYVLECAFHVAARKGSILSLHFLLDDLEDGDGDILNINGETPLHEAVKNGQPEIADYLANSGKFDINYPTPNGENVLHLSVKRGHTSLVNNMILSGAYPYLMNKNGLIPVEMAENMGRSDLVQLFHGFG